MNQLIELDSECIGETITFSEIAATDHIVINQRPCFATHIARFNAGKSGIPGRIVVTAIDVLTRKKFVTYQSPRNETVRYQPILGELMFAMLEVDVAVCFDDAGNEVRITMDCTSDEYRLLNEYTDDATMIVSTICAPVLNERGRYVDVCAIIGCRIDSTK